MVASSRRWSSPWSNDRTCGNEGRRGADLDARTVSCGAGGEPPWCSSCSPGSASAWCDDHGRGRPPDRHGVRPLRRFADPPELLANFCPPGFDIATDDLETASATTRSPSATPSPGCRRWSLRLAEVVPRPHHRPADRPTRGRALASSLAMHEPGIQSTAGRYRIVAGTDATDAVARSSSTRTWRGLPISGQATRRWSRSGGRARHLRARSDLPRPHRDRHRRRHQSRAHRPGGLPGGVRCGRRRPSPTWARAWRTPPRRRRASAAC